MALPIAGFSIVVKKDQIQHLIDSKAIAPANDMAWDDGHIWKFSFVGETAAREFSTELSLLGLNMSEGPDSDGVLVSEFDQSIEPYCEWLEIASYHKSVLVWLHGTSPEKVTTYEGWDPTQGSGLRLLDTEEVKSLKFLRLSESGHLEVWLNQKSGKEVYFPRSAPLTQELLDEASGLVFEHGIDPGEDPLEGEKAELVRTATNTLRELRQRRPDDWYVYYAYAKGLGSLGERALAVEALIKAQELQPDEENIPRELAGHYLALGRFGFV